MPVIDQVIEHFNAKGVKVIEVPEWGDSKKPLLIYASPLTMNQKTKIFKKAHESDASLFVDLLIMKAKDGEGNLLFTLADKPTLMRQADVDVIIRVGNEILGGSDDLEQAEKNLKTPTS